MLRFLPQRPAPWSRLLVSAAMVVAMVPIEPSRIAADEVILEPTPLVRKFPQGSFCPFPIKMEFVSTGGTATIFVTTNTYVFDGTRPPGEQMVYTHQGIDNMVVVRDSIYDLHRLYNNNPSSEVNACYVGAHVDTIFLFDQLNPGDAQLLELFDSPPSGWDLANGAYYETGRSGPINPSDPENPVSGTGCLGLGPQTATPSLADSGRTQITIGGLFPAKRYVLTGWWSVDDGIEIGTNDPTITIKITGPDQTPLAQKTWGALKARYR